MGRPRKAETRQHQINIRFTTPELVRIHAEAAQAGKTVPDYARAALLRRPPRRRKASAGPTLVALPEDVLAKWQVLGTALNSIAHRLNASDQLPAPRLFTLLPDLQSLFTASLGSYAGSQTSAYRLAPPVRYHLRKIGANLVQIKRRCTQLGLDAPADLDELLKRIRALMSGDRPAHGP